jgi:DHA1 family bicyclomycin/chloramphenicol resistance-like MFS transporter
MAGAFTIASALVGRLGSKLPYERIYVVAASVAALSALIALTLTAIGWTDVFALVGTMALLSFAMGFMVPLAFASAMAPYPAMAGTASALIGFVQSVFSAAMGALVGVMFNGTGLPMFALIALLAIGALLSFVLIRPAPTSSVTA